MEPRDRDTTDAGASLDRDAFRALLGRELPRVRAFLSRLGAPTDDLDDLTQEVFLTVIRRLGWFRHESKISTWVFGIAVNVLRGWRRRRDVDVRELDGIRSAGPTPDGDLVAREEGERLRRTLQRLSPPLREVFVLRHVEGLPAVDVAEALGLPEGTVRRRAHEARLRLRTWLADAAPVDRREVTREDSP
ncbi:MAG: RNA polymerase sigma factor [Planctomycetota bacterium JB042]